MEDYDFLIRVELRDVDPLDIAPYTKLHNAMKEFGCRTLIEDSTYKLPAGLYLLSSLDFTREDVLKKTNEAAKKAERKCSIVVAEIIGISHLGLEENKA